MIVFFFFSAKSSLLYMSIFYKVFLFFLSSNIYGPWDEAVIKDTRWYICSYSFFSFSNIAGCDKAGSNLFFWISNWDA